MGRLRRQTKQGAAKQPPKEKLSERESKMTTFGAGTDKGLGTSNPGARDILSSHESVKGSKGGEPRCPKTADPNATASQKLLIQQRAKERGEPDPYAIEEAVSKAKQKELEDKVIGE